MRSKRKMAATVLGALALMLTTGATPVLCPIERDVLQSYRSAVEIYDQARRWSAIARWWIDPDAATRVKAQSSGKTEDVCQTRPASVAAR
ncbi:MAG TPA: hypothetical protein VF126_18155 [Acidobacteriaceae bacterium]